MMIVNEEQGGDQEDLSTFFGDESSIDSLSEDELVSDHELLGLF